MKPVSIEPPSGISLSLVKPPISFPNFSYKKGDKIATREAFGSALARISTREICVYGSRR